MTPEIDEDDEIIFIPVTCSTPVSDEVHPDFYDNIFPDEDVDYDMSSVDLNDGMIVEDDHSYYILIIIITIVLLTMY